MGMYTVMAFCLLKSILDPKLHNFIDVAAFDFQKMTILLSWQMKGKCSKISETQPC